MIWTQSGGEGTKAGCRWFFRLCFGVFPFGNRRGEIAGVFLANAVALTFAARIAIPQNLLEVVHQFAIGHGDPPVGKLQLRTAAAQQALEVLTGKNRLASRREVDMEIEPTVAALADGKRGFEALDTA